MNRAAHPVPAVPSVIARNARGSLTITLADGRCRELEPLRDACRESAHALRQQAIGAFADALAAAIRRLFAVRPARATCAARVLTHRA